MSTGDFIFLVISMIMFGLFCLFAYFHSDYIDDKKKHHKV